MGDVHCLVPPSEPGQPDSVKVVPIDDLLKLLQAGELLPTTKVAPTPGLWEASLPPPPPPLV